MQPDLPKALGLTCLVHRYRRSFEVVVGFRLRLFPYVFPPWRNVTVSTHRLPNFHIWAPFLSTTALTPSIRWHQSPLCIVR